jgi:hypothetical protein
MERMVITLEAAESAKKGSFSKTSERRRAGKREL